MRATLGAVLAGGRSQRMGTDKARLRFPGDHPMAVEVAAQLAPLCDAVVLVRRDQPDEAWTALDGAPLEVIRDGDGDSTHPLWGVAAALARAAEGWVVVAPCDTPWLRSEDLRLLLDAAGGEGAVAVDPDGRSFPLVAVYPTHRLDEARRAAREGWPARRFADPCAKVCLSARSLANLNAPDQLQPPP